MIPGRRAGTRVARGLDYAVAGLCGWYLLVYGFIALSRLTYPFDLEWMEGATVDHVRRILDGQRIYVRPSLAFTPYLYPPFYYYVSAAMSLVTGAGVVPLRFVSFACSLGVFWLLFALVRRETGDWRAGLAAAGLFAATYRIGGAWFDLARVDSLFLLLTMAAAYLLRFGDSRRGWAAAGAFLALAALTKQTALMIAGPLIVYAIVVDWRRAVVFIAALAAVFGTITALLDAATRGWYLYYVVALPARVQEVGAIPADFWRHDVLAAMPIAAVVGAACLAARLLGGGRAAWFYGAFAVAMVGSAWAARLHAGAFDNVLIPAYLAFAVLLALALGLPAQAAGLALTLRTIVAGLCAIQLLALAYDPRPQIPGARDVALQQQLMRIIGGADGEVLLAQHGYFPLLAGKAPHAQSWAITDILRAGGEAQQRQMTDEIRQALASHRFGMIVLDRLDAWMEPDLSRYYHRSGPVFDRDGLWTVTGYRTRPQWIYLPN